MSLVVADYVVPGNSGVIKVGKVQCNAPSDNTDLTNKLYVDTLAGTSGAVITTTTLNWFGAQGPASCEVALATVGRMHLMQFRNFNFTGNDSGLQAQWASVDSMDLLSFPVTASSGGTNYIIYCRLMPENTISLSGDADFAAGIPWSIYGFTISWISSA